MAKVLPTSP